MMRCAIDISPAGSWGDPRTMASLAALAERSGWDGVFLEDYLVHPTGLETYDPWVSLAAIALATERIRIGTLVTPVPRRRPWTLAAQAMTLDRLSEGRLILGVGLGDPESDDSRRFGEIADLRERAGIVDESLAILGALWTGEPVTHHGAHFDLDAAVLRPTPVQRPRIPVWIGGQLTRRRPRERALRWDGSCLYRVTPPAWDDVTPEDVRALRAEAAQRPDSGRGFDIVVGGRERNTDLAAELDYLTQLRDAGATWWHEFLPPTTSEDDARAVIAAGPLRPQGT